MTIGQVCRAGAESRRFRLAPHIAALLLVAHATTAVAALPHKIPDFGTDPSRTTVRSVQSGTWSTASTWSSGIVPTANQVVHIDPGHVVTIDTTSAVAYTVAVHGTLRFNPAVNTRLHVTNLMVMGDHGMRSMATEGHLEVGTVAAPVAANVTAEIVIRNTPIGDSVSDPEQFGTGILCMGKVTMHGAVKNPTFIRTSVEPRAGHTTLTLESAVSGWRVGDRIFLPDTRQVPADNWFNPNYALQVEERTIQSISADGRTIMLSSPLTHDHRGARDADGRPTMLPNGIKLLPHVGNLTRNIVIRSENPSGTRGHTIYTARSAVSIAYVQYQDLGRTRAEPLHSSTNAIGRYPLHLHHNWGPVNPTNTGYQFSLVGNAVNDSLKWPIAIHASHYGLISENVVYGGSQLTGAGIAIEDGTETENLFERNFVANIRGAINSRESGPNTADGTTPGSAAECYWGVGFNNRFVGNVAATCRNTAQQIVSGPGWKFVVLAAPYTTQNPRFRGADMNNASQTKTVTPQHQPVIEFRDNEVYGIAADGLTFWQLGTDGYGIIPATMGETVVKDFRVWHTYEGAVWNYPSHKVTYDGLVYRIDPAATQYWQAAVQCGDYRFAQMKIRNANVHAGSLFGGCIDPLGTIYLENNQVTAHGAAFIFETPATPGTRADRPSSGVTFILRNNVVRAWPGTTLRTIAMEHNTSRSNNQPDDKYEVFVYDHQGVAGDNFRTYFGVQASQNLYGGVAPCTNTTARVDVGGITCNAGGTPAAPTVNGSATPTTISSGGSSRLTRTSSDATSVIIDNGIGSVPTDGSHAVPPPAATTSRNAATNAGGSATATATVTVASASSASAGLVEGFSFSEGSGTQTIDTSSNATVGVLTNGVAWTAQGKNGTALTFDGVDDYVRVSSPNMPTGDFTWQAWVKPAQWKLFQAIMMAGNDVGPELTLDGSGRVVVVHSNGELRLIGTSSIPLATWTHLALTRSGSVLKIYVNGVEDAVSGTSQTPLDFGSCALLIGVDSDAGCTGALNGYFDGTVDEVRVHNRALSVSEIQQEMSRQ